jgi:hypothetical protein
MTRSSFRLLGLCAVVLGLIAFSAGTAQAETGANWLVNGKTAGGLLSVLVSEVSEHWAILSEVLGITLNILCEDVTFVSIHLEGNGSLTNGGKLQLSGCLVYLKGELNSKCKPKAGGAEVGTILTNSMKGLLVLVGGSARIRLEPASGETIASVSMGAECPIGETIPIRGKLFLKDAEMGTNLVKHSMTEDSTNSHLWILNLTAEHEVTCHFLLITFLAGIHESFKWSGDPA